MIKVFSFVSAILVTGILTSCFEIGDRKKFKADHSSEEQEAREPRPADNKAKDKVDPKAKDVQPEVDNNFNCDGKAPKRIEDYHCIKISIQAIKSYLLSINNSSQALAALNKLYETNYYITDLDRYDLESLEGLHIVLVKGSLSQLKLKMTEVSNAGASATETQLLGQCMATAELIQKLHDSIPDVDFGTPPAPN